MSTSTTTARAVNDLVLKVGTVNGSGSQTANNVLLRTLFGMGIPCSGKNIFPSNIAGLPTWFLIRAHHRGYRAPGREVDVFVTMNATTARADVQEVRPGGMVIHDVTMPVAELRDDVTFHAVPFQDLVRACCPNAKLRKLVVNMIYVGVVARMLGCERGEIDNALARAFSTKPKALELNREAVETGWNWAGENLSVPEKPAVERMDANGERFLVDGNEAAALGCLFAGVTVLTWYPITPSSSLGEALIGHLADHRIDPDTGKATFAVVQAEDEIAAIGMAIGAGWGGARSMTATSGPGISLMGEFVGLAYYAEIPVVIVDVQRVGPSTGLPTRTMQGDLLLAAHLSHGDTKHIVLLPSSTEECFTMAQDAFEFSERFQTPVFLLSDLDLGMNTWATDPFPYPEAPENRGKVFGEADLAGLEAGGWGRYRDVDGDGIPYRTLPGTPGGRGAYFTRGSGHDGDARYTESGEAYVENMDRLSRKLETARSELPAPQVTDGDGRSTFGLLHFGTTRWAMDEARDLLHERHDIAAADCRVLAYPLHDDVRAFIERHERVYVVEQNRDAQMKALLCMDYPDLAPRLRSILQYDGMPMYAATIVDGVLQGENS